MGIGISSGFDMNAALPLDSRSVVADLTARDAIISGKRYEGMSVYVISEEKSYTLKNGVTNSDWADGGGSIAYTPSLSVTVGPGGDYETWGEMYAAVSLMFGDMLTITVSGTQEPAFTANTWPTWKSVSVILDAATLGPLWLGKNDTGYPVSLTVTGTAEIGTTIIAGAYVHDLTVTGNDELWLVDSAAVNIIADDGITLQGTGIECGNITSLTDGVLLYDFVGEIDTVTAKGISITGGSPKLRGALTKNSATVGGTFINATNSANVSIASASISSTGGIIGVVYAVSDGSTIAKTGTVTEENYTKLYSQDAGRVTKSGLIYADVPATYDWDGTYSDEFSSTASGGVGSLLETVGGSINDYELVWPTGDGLIGAYAMLGTLPTSGEVQLGFYFGPTDPSESGNVYDLRFIGGGGNPNNGIWYSQSVGKLCQGNIGVGPGIQEISDYTPGEWAVLHITDVTTGTARLITTADPGGVAVPTSFGNRASQKLCLQMIHTGSTNTLYAGGTGRAEIVTGVTPDETAPWLTTYRAPIFPATAPVIIKATADFYYPEGSGNHYVPGSDLVYGMLVDSTTLLPMPKTADVGGVQTSTDDSGIVVVLAGTTSLRHSTGSAAAELEFDCAALEKELVVYSDTGIDALTITGGNEVLGFMPAISAGGIITIRRVGVDLWVS